MIYSIPASLLEAAKTHVETNIYESFVLTEDRVDFLKEKNPVIDTSHDKNAASWDTTASAVIDHLAAKADPTKKKIHTQWILGQYKQKNIRLEDSPRVNAALSEFEKHKAKLSKKDINQYKNIGEIEDAVQPHFGTAASNAEKIKQTTEKGRTLIHAGKDGTHVYRLEPTPEGKEASQNIYGGGHSAGGTHTSWCTAARSEQCMFDHYSKSQPLHVIHTPSGKVYQAHPVANQLMNSRDEPVSAEVEDSNRDWVPHPDAGSISNGLDHIPNGWKLKLSHNLPNITSSDIEHGLAQTDDDEIAKAAAKHPNASPNALKIAATHQSGVVRQAAASNPNMPRALVDALLNDKSTMVRATAAEHPSNTSEKLEEIYTNNRDNRFSREAAVSHKNASQALLMHAISNDPHSGVARAAVRNPIADADTLRHAVNTHAPYISDALKNPNVPPDVIDVGLHDDSWRNQYSQMEAIQHPNANADNISKALNSSVESVRSLAVQHHNATSEHLFKGINDTSIVANAVMQNPNATHEHIEMGLNSGYGTVKAKAIAHPNATHEQLERAINSNDIVLQAGAASNKNLTKTQIDKLRSINHHQINSRLNSNITSIHHEMEELGL